MNLESRDYLVRRVRVDDKDAICKIEFAMPWIKIIAEQYNVYFEILWNTYLKSEDFWIIESKSLGTVAYIQVDPDSDEEAHLYIHFRDYTEVSGFGKQLLRKTIEYISQELGFTIFYVEMWDENDPSRHVFEEAGYEIEDGGLEIDV